MSTTKKVFSHFVLLLFSFWWLPFTSTTGHKPASPEEDYIAAHLEDAHCFHFGDVKLYLPVLLYHKTTGFHHFSSRHLYHLDEQGEPRPYRGFFLQGETIQAKDQALLYDLSITKNAATMWLSIWLLLLLFTLLALYYTRRSHGRPKGISVLLLYLVRYVRNDIARANIGPHHYERFTPYLLTIFFYILLNNLLGLLPLGANVTGNISAVFVLALFTFLITTFSGNRHYWGHLLRPPGVPFWLLPLMVPIELASALIKPFTLMLRLFANMLAGHLVLLALISFMFTFKNLLAATIVVPFGAGLILLKIFAACIQAYIFTLLSAMAFGAAVASHEE